MSQGPATRDEAIKALTESKGDIVQAIMVCSPNKLKKYQGTNISIHRKSKCPNKKDIDLNKKCVKQKMALIVKEFISTGEFQVMTPHAVWSFQSFLSFST